MFVVSITFWFASREILFKFLSNDNGAEKVDLHNTFVDLNF